MVGKDTQAELLSTVLQRLDIIESLRETAKDKRTLEENVDYSRSTVNRAVRKLEAQNMIKYVDGQYTVTPLCETIAAEVTDLMNTIELWLKLAPFLQWIPEDEFDFDLQLLADADILTPEPHNPYAMVNKHVQALESMQSLRAILPLTGLHAHQVCYEQIVHNDAEAEIVVEPGVAGVLQSDPEYAPMTEEMIDTGQFNIYVYEGSIPYAVCLIDELTQIGVDDHGEPRALLETDEKRVREWADNVFSQYKQQAQPSEIAVESAKSVGMS